MYHPVLLAVLIFLIEMNILLFILSRGLMHMEMIILFVAAYLAIGLIFGYVYRFFVHSRSQRFIANEMPPVPLAIIGWPIVAWICVFLGLAKLYERIPPTLIGIDDTVSRFFSRKIHEDRFGKLYDMPSPYGRIKKVRVEDSTGVYWIAVPREMTRAKEAVAWTYNMAEEQYDPERV